MNHRLSLIFFCLGLLLSSTRFFITSDHVEATGDEKNTSFKILFVGNSLTYTHNLPQIVTEQALLKGVSVKTRMIAKPNYAIVDHWAEGEVQSLIKTEKYDYVILQQGPSSQENGKQMLIEGGKEYSNLCETYGSRLCYFMVWPSRTYYHTFDGVIANYTEAAQKNDAILLPVGKVWKDHFDSTENFNYYGPDGFHPSRLGSEVAAKVMVEALF